MASPLDATRWAPYEPTPDAPWNLRRIVHLHRRAGFGATWPELERDLKDGPKASVARVLDGRARLGGVPDDFESIATRLADAAVASGDSARLQAWWVYRMLFSPDPLAERLTLLWHDHFPTALAKVDDLDLVRRQNETHRRLARASFADLLEAEVREPALLLYLDAPTNRRDHPNENLARELMELFTLGIGHYTEIDVKAAARALTGWTVEGGQFRDATTRHDGGEKTILGRAGRWTGDDLVRILREHPATAGRLAARLCGLFFGEGGIAPSEIDALADGLRANGLSIDWGLRTILRSRAFFAEKNLGTRVLGPADFVIGACRALVPANTAPSTLLLAEWIGRLGQELLNPPNVGGWPGGRAWLNSQSLIARAKFATALVEGRSVGLPDSLDAAAIAAGQGRGGALGGVLEATAKLLCGVVPTPARRANWMSAARGGTSEAEGRRALSLVLASPEAQLG